MFAVECKHKGQKGLITFLAALLAGCAPMAEIAIQVMDPAEITWPGEIRQLAFMNRSVFPHRLMSDTSPWTNEELFILDTIMDRWIFRGMRTSMNESPLFDIDTIRVIPARRSDTSGILRPLGRSALKNLTLPDQADALVCLEYYTVDDSINAVILFDEGFYYRSYMGIYTTSVWRIYDLIRDTVFDEFILRDTSEWYGYEGTYEASLNELPLAINALREAAFALGIRYGYRISPGWIEVPRFYFRGGNKEMRMASNRAGEGDWQGAAATWKLIAGTPENEKMAARACFNMALVYEMDDLLIPAVDWALKSYGLRQINITKEYINLLQKRYEDREKLRKQLPSF